MPTPERIHDPAEARPGMPRPVPAEAHVFGHPPTTVVLEVIPRSTRWRRGRALRWFLLGAVLAPLLAILPPHAPWGVAAAMTGVVLGVRRWRESYTLVGIEGPCPRCGQALESEGATPLSFPHAVGCPACGNLVTLQADLPAG